ncbi:MAG: glycine betaine ABC transporter substrate-binding protein [Paracoccaceae bacterium]
MKLRITSAALVAGAFALPGAAMADCGEVSLAKMNWASAEIYSTITQFLMVQGYGCDVTVVPSATNTAITSLAENGEPDIVPELWVNSAPAYHKLAAEGKVLKAADVISDGGSENWWIPSYLAEAHPELTTIDGILANPELVGGRFHNCPDGWGCRFANDNLVQAYGFDAAGMEVFNHGSGETLASSMAAAYQSQEPWFGYYWGPTALLGNYSMVAVDMGGYNADAHSCNASADCATPGKSSFPAAPVYTVVTASLPEREPEIAELVSNISLSNTEMSQLLAWRSANNASAEEAAVYFLTSAQDTWSGWVNDEARGKLSALFQ